MKRIKVENKRQLNKAVKEYRSNGYMIVTFGYTLVELERGNELVVIEY